MTPARKDVAMTAVTEHLHARPRATGAAPAAAARRRKRPQDLTAHPGRHGRLPYRDRPGALISDVERPA